ncbi:MAG: hypothetical protein CMG63_02840 [Candidatus Marinimicrobia bacterium]|nr:hypothetical protein [Candidatus Neomarinimicrobiota bacterium]
MNPGDKKHTISNIRKITSGSNNEISIFIDELYNSIIRAGTFKASSIAVAEAAKVIENTQRDVNIALINELAIIFNKLKIDTKEVLDAASTKWNFLPFQPGLVGGHCIGVDPYYLTHKAIEVGYHPDIILAGRKINDNVGYFIVENMISEMSRQGINPIEAKVSVLGLTFKENCPDLRNTKVSSITSKLKELNCNLTINDPWADEDEIAKIFKIKPKKIVEINNQDVVMVAVSHVEYSKFKKQDWRRMLAPNGIVIDVKSIYSKDYFDDMNIAYWRL